MVDEVSCSAPPTYELQQTQDDQFNFTAFFMAPLDETDVAGLR